MKKIWRFTASTELTIILAALICLDAGVGSFYTVKYPEFYRSLDQGILLPRLLGVGTEYLSFTAWIYILIILVAFFAINTVVCTVDRLYAIISKGRAWFSICPHVVHVGFLIAVLGHLVASTYGFKSPVSALIVGRPVQVSEAEGLSVRYDGIDIKTDARGEVASLKSRLTLIRDDRVIKSGVAELNGPLLFEGIAFYYMKHGRTTSGVVVEIDGLPVSAEFGSIITLADSKEIRLGRVYPDFAFDGGGRAVSLSPNYRNPHMEISTRDGRVAYINLSRPGSVVELSGMNIRIVDYMSSEYVLVSIVKDPGIRIIIAGSTVLVLGMILVFIFRGRRAELVKV